MPIRNELGKLLGDRVSSASCPSVAIAAHSGAGLPGGEQPVTQPIVAENIQRVRDLELDKLNEVAGLSYKEPVLQPIVIGNVQPVDLELDKCNEMAGLSYKEPVTQATVIKNIQPVGDLELDKLNEDKIFTVKTVHKVSSGLIVDLVLGCNRLGEGVAVRAVLDTAADISIISETICQKLNIDCCNLTTFKVKCAGQDLSFPVKRLDPISVQAGSLNFKADLFSGPIEDEMILGLDLLSQLGANIDVPKNQVVFQNHTVPISNVVGGGKVRRLILHSKLIIPPMSELSINVPAASVGSMCDGGTGTFILDPVDDSPALIPPAVYCNDPSPRVAFLNQTDENIILPKGLCVGNLENIDEENIINDFPETPHAEETLPEEEDVHAFPGMLQELLTGVDNGVSRESREKLSEILLEFKSVFSKDKFDLGSFSALHHEIDTGSADPIKLGMRRVPFHFAEEEERLVKEMLENGIIRPSVSSWAAAPVLVRKKNGEFRYCVDYRRLNSVTKKDVFPLPLMTECIDALEGNVWFSQIDAQSAYWQVPLSPEAREKTAFRTRLGLFEFTRVPFGLANAPSTFSRVMDLTLKGLHWKTALAFLDDVVILGKTEDDHLQNIRLVLSRFKEFGLKLKVSKCHFFKKEVEFLGRIVSCDGVSLTDHSIETIRSWPVPKTIKEVRGFLGLVNFHRPFISRLADRAMPLQQLLKDDKFTWGEQQQKAFVNLKESLTQAPVLTAPTKDGSFVLDCDCSDFALGGQLSQVQNGETRTIAFCSFLLNEHERKYCTTRKELLALVRVTHHFRHYLLGRPFEIRTDHSSLQWLINFKSPEGQLARWLEILSSFDMNVRYRQGRQHVNADSLSRIPARCAGEWMGMHLPCRGCKYCSHSTHKFNWGQIDDVGPLYLSSRVRQTNSDTTGFDINLINSHPSNNVLLLSQRKDPQLKPLIEFLESGKTIEEEVRAGWDPATKFYYENKDVFFIDKPSGVLYFDDGIRELIVVPKEMKEEIMSLCHDIPSSAHLGISNTKNRVKERFFWYRLAKDVKSYVKCCPACNTNKHSIHPNRFTRIVYQAGQPLQKVHVDFLGPLPKTKNGNQFILVLVDNFSKWLEAIPLPNQEAETTARAAINEFFARFGFPLELVSDQGANFNSALFSEVCRVLHIHKSRTTAYRPSANGQVERFNRTLLNCLRGYVNKAQNDWDEFLPLICSAIRSTVNRRTGYTPNKLMLGRETMGPVDLLYPGLPMKDYDVNEYVDKLQEELFRCHEEARKHLNACVKKEKKNFDKRAKVIAFQRGDIVYFLDNSPSSPGKCRKLRPVWKGPALIVKALSPHLFLVKLGYKSQKVMNHDRLKKCLTNTLPLWLHKERKKLLENQEMLYCLCQQPDDGSWYIECSVCGEWFHSRCLGRTRGDLMKEEEFKCPKCLDFLN